MSSTNSNQKFMAWAIVAIVLLLGTNIYQWWKISQLKQDVTVQKTELTEVEETKALLEKDYELALASLEELKGDNEELNQVIEEQKSDLKNQKDRISKLIKTSGQLEQAKKEIAKLSATAQKYVEEINQLKAENEMLATENTQLKTETETLSSNLQSVSQEKDAIQKEKEIITQEKERLSSDFAMVSVKANKASVIELKDIDVKGYRVKESGKLSKRKSASSVDLLDLCFTMVPNEIADKGVEKFIIKLIGPDGVTIHQQQASTFKKEADGTESKYTFSANYSSPAKEEKVCSKYEPKLELQKGTYNIEIYNKGYLTGKGSFKLR